MFENKKILILKSDHTVKFYLQSEWEGQSYCLLNGPYPNQQTCNTHGYEEIN